MAYQKIDISSKILGLDSTLSDPIPAAFLQTVNSNLNEFVVRERNVFQNQTYNLGLSDIEDIESEITVEDVPGNYTWVYDAAGDPLLQKIDRNPDTIGMQFSSPLRKPAVILIPYMLSPDAENIVIRVAMRCDQMSGSMWATLIGSQAHNLTYPPMMRFNYDDSDTASTMNLRISEFAKNTSGFYEAPSEIRYNPDAFIYGTTADDSIYDSFIDFFDTVDLMKNGVKVGVTDDPATLPDYAGLSGVNYYELTIPLFKLDNVGQSLGNVAFPQLDPKVALNDGSQRREYSDWVGFIALSFFGGVDTKSPKIIPSKNLEYLRNWAGVNPNPFALVDRGGLNSYENMNPNSFGKYHHCIEVTQQLPPPTDVRRTKLHSIQSIHGVLGPSGVTPTYGGALTKNQIDPVYVVYPALFTSESAQNEIVSTYDIYPVSKFTVYSVSIEEVPYTGV